MMYLFCMLAMVLAAAHAAEVCDESFVPFAETEQIMNSYEFREGSESVNIVVSTPDMGEVFRHQRGGGFNPNIALPVASSSKWITALIFAGIIEDEDVPLSWDSKPGDFFPWWTKENQITLRSLLTMTSGFEFQDDFRVPCVRDHILNVLEYIYGESQASYFDRLANSWKTLEQCAQEAYDIVELAHENDKYFSYASIHAQIAGAMAVKATGKSWAQLVTQYMDDRFGVDVSYGVGLPLVAGTAFISSNDYVRLMNAVLEKRQLTDDTYEFMEKDYTPTGQVEIGFTPLPGAHYAIGHWLECPVSIINQIPYDDTLCIGLDQVSSPGFFGLNPWVDRANQYNVVLGRFALGNAPFVDSYALGLTVRSDVTKSVQCLRYRSSNKLQEFLDEKQVLKPAQ